jgi:hypothetical protein
MRILHVFKITYTLPRHHYLGATKDIRSRTEYFRDRGFDFEEFHVVNRKQCYKYLTCKSRKQWEQYSAILFEMTFSPGVIRLAREQAPHAIITVRSHNAELLHRLDWARAQGYSLGSIRSLIHALKNTLTDYLSGSRADFLLSINRWEAENYWRYLIDRQKLKCVPFFLPESYTAQIQNRYLKRQQCVNFASSETNPLIVDATKNFVRAVRNLNGRCNEWTFCVTGNRTKLSTEPSDRIQWTGLLENPYQVLAESKAMALLSNYGFGFKTKILEAILARTFILVPKGLYRRMPDEVRAYCIPVDIRSSESFQNALEESTKPFPKGNPNAEFRRQAFAALDEIFLS